MGKTKEASTHLGGPLGLAGLVLMFGAAGGLAVVSAIGGGGGADEAAPASVPGEIEIADAGSEMSAGDGDIIVNPETIPPSDPSAPAQPAVARDVTVPEADPPLTITLPERPAPVPEISEPPMTRDPVERPVTQAPDVSVTAPVRSLQPALEKADFIVRFKGVAAVDECLELFRRDEAAGQKAFEAWAESKPELSGVRLSGVTYSGEAILTYEGAKDETQPVARVGVIERRIQSIEGVRYADPDYTAHPGKGDE